MHDRQLEGSRRLERGQARHPEVAVHDVRASLAPAALQVAGELAHVRQQLVLREDGGGAGVDVVDDDAGTELDLAFEHGVVAAGVDDHLGAAARKRARQRRHVDVLATSVDAAEDGERASVLRDECDAHRSPPQPVVHPSR
jgi:hypothetical protein